jgi:surface antigen
MKKLLIVAVVATLTGCQQMGQRETLGTFGGAALGGLVGAQFGGGSGRAIATAVGIMGGAMLGRGIGQQLDRADRARVTTTFANALETRRNGQSTYWRNPNNGNSGYTRPTATYKTNSGGYCREYQSMVQINGKQQRAYGTACRQSDGSWEVK